MAEAKILPNLPAGNARVIDDPRNAQVDATASDKPKDEMHELTGWVMNRVKQWRSSTAPCTAPASAKSR
jgi:hypothetical protein